MMVTESGSTDWRGGPGAQPTSLFVLRERQLPLDVAPTSNVRTRQVGSLRAHPLPCLLDAGLLVTLNSDDPPMFGTTLSNEYLVAATELGLSRAQLAGLASNAVRASFLDDAAKDTLSTEIAAVGTAGFSQLGSFRPGWPSAKSEYATTDAA